MFLAPCTLPLIPAFLAVLSGDKNGLSPLQYRHKMLTNAAFFSFGFSIIFITLGLLAGMLGGLVNDWVPLLRQISGFLLIIFAVTLFFRLSIIKFGQGGFPLPRFIVPGTKSSSLMLGVFFSLSWSPCIGPILGTILLMASTANATSTAALLLVVFSVGLSTSFMLCAYLFSRFQAKLATLLWLETLLRYTAATIIAVIGVLLLIGQEGLILDLSTRAFNWLGLDFLYNFY